MNYEICRQKIVEFLETGSQHVIDLYELLFGEKIQLKKEISKDQPLPTSENLLMGPTPAENIIS